MLPSLCLPTHSVLIASLFPAGLNGYIEVPHCGAGDKASRNSTVSKEENVAGLSTRLNIPVRTCRVGVFFLLLFWEIKSFLLFDSAVLDRGRCWDISIGWMNKLHTYICICKWAYIYRHTCNIYHEYAYACVHIFIHTRLVSSIVLKFRKDLKGVKPMEPMEPLCALIWTSVLSPACAPSPLAQIFEGRVWSKIIFTFI